MDGRCTVGVPPVFDRKGSPWSQCLLPQSESNPSASRIAASPYTPGSTNWIIHRRIFFKGMLTFCLHKRWYFLTRMTQHSPFDVYLTSMSVIVMSVIVMYEKVSSLTSQQCRLIMGIHGKGQNANGIDLAQLPPNTNTLGKWEQRKTNTAFPTPEEVLYTSAKRESPSRPNNDCNYSCNTVLLWCVTPNYCGWTPLVAVL